MMMSLLLPLPSSRQKMKMVVSSVTLDLACFSPNCCALKNQLWSRTVPTSGWKTPVRCGVTGELSTSWRPSANWIRYPRPLLVHNIFRRGRKINNNKTKQTNKHWNSTIAATNFGPPFTAVHTVASGIYDTIFYYCHLPIRAHVDIRITCSHWWIVETELRETTHKREIDSVDGWQVCRACRCDLVGPWVPRNLPHSPRSSAARSICISPCLLVGRARLAFGGDACIMPQSSNWQSWSSGATTSARSLDFLIFPIRIKSARTGRRRRMRNEYLPSVIRCVFHFHLWRREL